MTSREEAWLLSGPRPSIASEKMLDHITEQNSPMPSTAHFAAAPEPVDRDAALAALEAKGVWASDVGGRRGWTR